MFLDGVARPDLGGKEETRSNAEKLFESINKIKNFGGNLLVLPAHFHEAASFPIAKKLNEINFDNFLGDSKEQFYDSMASAQQPAPPNYSEIKKLNQNFSNILRMQAEQLEFGPNRCAAK